MHFIVEQQALFASGIQQLQESYANGSSCGQRGGVVTGPANVTHAGFNEVNVKTNALVDVQIRTEENLARTSQNVARTDENLRNLIAVVDRYFSEGRNGN